MRWKIYIKYALSGICKYNFEGDKEKLMTLVGVIHSTEIEQCRVDYMKVEDFDITLPMISYVITDKKIYTRLRRL